MEGLKKFEIWDRSSIGNNYAQISIPFSSIFALDLFDAL